MDHKLRFSKLSIETIRSIELYVMKVDVNSHLKRE